MSTPKDGRNVPYNAYFQREIPPHDPELTSTLPGTPMGEYLRSFWQPVCLSQELTDLPKAIRIMGEDLVAFRDRRGAIGVLQRHCSHRGTSLEYGIVSERGIRCCYHGWLYDVDGTLLDTPCEPPESRLKQTVRHGAYPALERDGLVFAYMGPPAAKPAFPVYDSYVLPAATRLVAFSNVFPCNWLQVHENVMDHMHAAVLHNGMTVEGVDQAMAAGVTLQGFGDMPIMHWEPTRNGNAMIFIAGRRVSDEKVWIRITEIEANFHQIGSLVPSAGRERHSTVCMTRWNVPVDDRNMIIFGFRHFNDEVDPDHVGHPEDCGVDKVDFLVGQTRRGYEEGQRAPSDWEALTGQRPIAIHALEHPGSSDVGVFMCRKLLRDVVRGRTPRDTSRDAAIAAGDSLPSYGQDSVLHLPRREGAADREQILRLGKRVLEVMKETDALPSRERDAHVRRRLDDLDGGRGAAAPASRGRLEDAPA